MRVSITSPSNAKLKIARNLHSRAGIMKHGFFLMEGPRFVADYLSRETPLLILVSDTAGRLSGTVASEAAGMKIRVIEIPDKLFSDISDTQTSQGIAAVCPLPSVNIHDIPREGVFLLLDGISDPGNMGTIIRSAAAFGCTAIVTSKGSCCPFTPKVTRAAAGWNSEVPIIFDTDLAGFMQRNSNEMEFIGADASGGDVDVLLGLEGCLGLVIGSEACGIGEETRKQCSGMVALKMPGGVESLNAAVSASILLYETTKHLGSGAKT
ncbi:MAG: RNA methyltransferase [Candidatus Fermentibacteria bacterium]